MFRRSYIATFILSCLLAFPSAFCYATDYNYQPSDLDNFIRGESTSHDLNYGSQTYIRLISYTVYNDRGLVQFDVSDIPDDATITDATVSLYYYGYGGTEPENYQVDVCKISHNDWSEPDSTWHNYKSGTTWTSAGGDWETVSPACTHGHIPADYGWFVVNVKDIVADAVVNETGLVNLFLIMNPEGNGDYEPLFYSNNYAGDTSLCPKLLVVTESDTGTSSGSAGFTFIEFLFIFVGIFFLCYIIEIAGNFLSGAIKRAYMGV